MTLISMRRFLMDCCIGLVGSQLIDDGGNVMLARDGPTKTAIRNGVGVGERIGEIAIRSHRPFGQVSALGVIQSQIHGSRNVAAPEGRMPATKNFEGEFLRLAIIALNSGDVNEQAR